MAILANISTTKHIKQHLIINEISEKEQQIARNNFRVFKENKVILSNFSDSVWTITDQTNTVRLDFRCDEVLIKKSLKKTSVTEYIDYLKYYMLLLFGKNSILLLRRTVKNIIIAIEATECFTNKPNDDGVLWKYGVSEFIDLAPEATLVVEEIMEERQYDIIHKREIAEFQSYFLLNDILEDYWQKANEMEKDLFYPILLWWKISMIIPVRPTEFTIIPKDCIRIEKEHYFLKIRRTHLKGTRGTHIRYNIENDYTIYEYEVSKEIAELVVEYRERTKKYKEAEIDSLFSDDMCKKVLRTVFNQSSIKKEYPHLRLSRFYLILEYFYTFIVQDLYGYRIIMKEELQEVDEMGEQRYLEEDEIIRVTLGDSRHISLQNMLLNGCTILMAKEITKHDTIDMIFHYSNNMKNLVKCRAYNLYRLQTNKVDTINLDRGSVLKKWLPDNTLESMEVDNGKCFSPSFVNENNPIDCYKVAGDCQLCKWFKGDLSSENKILEKQEKKLEEKIARLNMWVSSLAKRKNEEEIQILATQMVSEVKNLENMYVKKFQRENK
ncbi:hypothetical protein QTL86_02010 [Cellulosilyticum sp. ST5]|uniref:hypothetical protein n=1 Tax=Cellulosilyticum sp. ST5 TaxID=3055805 RepID=UPI003977B526